MLVLASLPNSAVRTEHSSPNKSLQRTGGQWSLVCQSLAGYQTWAGLMGSVGQQAQCDLNVYYVGIDLAQAIVAEFKAKGSIYADSCELPKMLSSPKSTTPATLICHRPTLQYHCDKRVQASIGTGPGQLPVKVLDCQLGAKQPARP